MVKIPYKNPKFDFPEVDREVDRGPRDRDLKFSTATDRDRDRDDRDRDRVTTSGNFSVSYAFCSMRVS